MDLSTNTDAGEQTRLPEIAFYHPWPPRDGRPISSWLKTMLLFFDGAAVLVAESDRSLLTRSQEETIHPLRDAGLLHLIDPSEVIDGETAGALTEFVLEIATAEQRQSLRDPGTRRSLAQLGDQWTRGPDSLSPSQIAASRMVWEEMHKRGYATRYRRGEPIFLESWVWAAILAFLAQALRPAGRARGLELLPATDDPQMLSGFRTLADERRLAHHRKFREDLFFPGRDVPSSADVVMMDLERVALDLSTVPINDLLQFRERHGAEYRKYASNVRSFAQEVAVAPAADRANLLRARREELAAEADQLMDAARAWWRQPLLSVSLGLAGTAWAGAQDNWPLASLSALFGLLDFSIDPHRDSAHSYLFRTGSQFRYR